MPFHWKQYFSFSKKERMAVAVLSIIMIISAAIPFIASSFQSSTTQIEVYNLLDSLPAPTSTTNTNSTLKNLFYFNPNTLPYEGWKQLGLKEKTIRTILNYRSKGGYFKQATDLKKIYGLSEAEAQQLIPYVQLPQENTVRKYSYTFYQKNIPIVDINTADTTAWKQLPAIGSVLSKRIVLFRLKVNGFDSITQLKQVKGITDSVFTIIQPYLTLQMPYKPPKVNINTILESEILLHPYIPPDVGKAIIIYRTKHGAYKSVEDIKNIVFINEHIFQSVAPYLTVE